MFCTQQNLIFHAGDQIVDVAIEKKTYITKLILVFSVFRPIQSAVTLPFYWAATTNNNALRTSCKFDYEEGDHSFNIVMEGSVYGYRGSATTTIQVTVIDMDEQDPVFTHTKYEIHIPENVRGLFFYYKHIFNHFFAFLVEFLYLT